MPSSREAPPELKKLLDENSEAVNKTIERLLPETDLPEAPLYEAMRYSIMAGGKRLRAFMLLESAKLFNVDPARAKRAAAALSTAAVIWTPLLEMRACPFLVFARRSCFEYKMCQRRLLLGETMGG